MMSFSAQATDKNSGAFSGLRLVPSTETVSHRHVLSGTTDNDFLMQWLDALDGLIAGLDRLPPLTEKSFLIVGGNLQDLCGRLRGISANAAQAALIMSGRDAMTVIEGLESALDSMEKQLAATNRTAAQAGAGLGLIIGELDDIHRLMANFKDRVGTLRMLKIITNIQGASMTRGAAGFQKVAADIGTLSKNVQAKSTAIIDKRRELHDELEKALTMVSSLEDKQKNLTDRVVADIQHGIASLAGMHKKCAVAADHIALHSGEMSRELSEVVMALQFHDITRQQMEHASAALVEVRVHIRKAHRDATAEDLSHSLGSVCALQTAQIANSTGELTNAVVSISRNLEGVSGEAANASASVQTLFGLAGSVGQASFTEIESGLSAVLTAFADNEMTTSHLTRIMLSVTTAIGEITSFAEDIDYIGSEIKLIALNAIIKAVQAGKDGAAFGVIAETVKQQSEEICQQASAITAAIGRVTVHLDVLKSELQGEDIDCLDDQHEAGGIGCEMANAIAILKGLSETVMALLVQTEGSATGLASDIETTIERLDNREIRELVEKEIPDQCDRLMLAVRKCTQDKAAGLGRNSLEMFQKRYTMQSERKVHELFAVEAVVNRSSPDFALSGGGRLEDDFGDNVELF